MWLNSFIKEEYFLFKGMGMEKMADLGSCLEMRSWNAIAVCLVDNMTSYSFSLLSSFSEGKQGIG